METIEGLMLEVAAGRSVGIEISNKTRSTLENPRTHCFSGHDLVKPENSIPPGKSGSCVFVKTSYSARGSVGVLSYESDAFTLAIMFSNPFDRVLYNSEFAIELFAGRKHFESMERLYQYMYNHGPPYKCESFERVELEMLDGELVVTNQGIQATATVSNKDKATIKVEIKGKDDHTDSPSNPGKWPM
ncbi:DELTA-actitoxin-Aas1a-like [Pelodiscus sinensis]|uniref:DELTA-actitoxin-Aas1a-like n=1 Tax=Pelodiscus sinensis TaxID=13735 RepID=UPI003F6C6765